MSRENYKTKTTTPTKSVCHTRYKNLDHPRASRISSYSRLKLILERTELIIEASKIKKEINTSFLGCNYVPCLPSSGGFLYIFSYELPSQRKKNNNIYKSSTGLCNVCVVHYFHPRCA